MAEPPYLRADEIDQVIDACRRLGLVKFEVLHVIRDALPPRVKEHLPSLQSPADLLRSDLYALNTMESADGVEPPLAVWMKVAIGRAYDPDLPAVALLKRLRRRVLRQPETVQVRYIAPPNCEPWVAQLADALGYDVDYVFDIGQFERGQRPDLTVLMFDGRCDEETAAVAESLLRDLDPPLFLFLRGRELVRPHFDDAQRLYELEELASRHVRVVPIAATAGFIEAVRPEIAKILKEMEAPGDRRLAQERQRIYANVPELIDWSGTAFEALNAKARAAFDAEDFASALTTLQALRDKLIESPTLHQSIDQQRLTQTRISIACCHANLQDQDAARAAIAELSDDDIEALPEKGADILAGFYVVTNQAERGRALIKRRGLTGRSAELLAAMDGAEPDADADSSVLNTAAARAMEIGDLARLARVSARLTQVAAPGSLSALLGLRGLIHALSMSVIGVGQRTRVPIPERPALVDTIGRLIEATEPRAEEPHQGFWARIEFGWAQLTAWGAPPDVPEALRDQVSPLNASWMPALNAVIELTARGAQSEANEASLALAEQHPSLEPVQQVRAGILMNSGRFEAAVAPAQVAFAQLPVPRNRWLLGAALLHTDRIAEAWRIVAPLRACAHPDGALLYAQAAQALPEAQLDLDTRLAAWAHYQRLRPDDLQARFAPIAALQRFGRIQEAQDRALELVHTHPVSPRDILQVARLLMLTDDRRDDLIGLMQRLAGDESTDAERARMQLSLRIGHTSDYEPDWSTLHAVGAVRSVSMDELVEQVVASSRFHGMADQLYAQGLFGLVEVARLRGQTVAQVVAEISMGARNLCPPLTFGRAALIRHDALEVWLVDRLTLHLMLEADLVESLETQMTAGHRLLMFSDDYAALGDEAGEIGSAGRDRDLEALRRLDALVAWIAELDSTIVDDAALARHTQAELIDWGAEADRTPEQLIRVLLAREYVDAADVEVAERWQATDGPDDLPERVVLGEVWLTPGLTYVLLRALHRAQRPVHLTVRQRQALTRQINAAERWRALGRRATRLFKLAAQWLAKGWIETIDRPPVDLPPPTDEQHEMLHAVLQRELAFKAALIGHPERRWIGADFAPMASPLSAEFARVLAQIATWTPDRWTAFFDRYRAVDDQLLPLDTWAVYASDTIPAGLLRLGFLDGFDAQALRQYARRGFDEPAVLADFDRIEWVAAQPQHSGARLARVRIAARYVFTLNTLWSDGVVLAQTAQAATEFLLSRLEGPLSALPGASALELALEVAFGHLLMDPQQGLEEQDGQHFISANTPAGRFFAAIAQWVRQENRTQRRAAVRRALTRTLLLAQRESLEHEARVLLSTLDRAATGEGQLWVIPGLLVDAAILSANWSTRPLLDYVFGPEGERISYAELLERATLNLISQRRLGLDDRRLFVGIDVGIDGHESGTFWAPAEAIILRLPATAMDHLLPDFAAWIGATDGRLAALARALRHAPESTEARAAFARHAVCSPWRLIRGEPTQILRWEAAEMSGYPASIDDLFSMLSEVRWTEGQSVATYWQSEHLRSMSDRPELWEIMSLCGEVPGSSNDYAAVLLALHPSQDPVERFGWARDVLSAPPDHPAGRIALAILVMRLLADRHPTLTVEGAPVDPAGWLRQRLPTLVKSVSRGASSRIETVAESAATRLEAGELDMLHICRFVILQLRDVNTLRAEELPWLLYRLHGWLIAQLAFQLPEERAESIAALRAARARLPTSESRWAEGFDPRRFDSAEQYRSLVVLYALLGMEQLSQKAHQTFLEEDVAAQRQASEAFSSPALLERLRALAEQPVTDAEIEASQLQPLTHLDWRAPRSVSSMALRVLLRLDVNQWAELTEETRHRWFHHLHQFESSLSEPNRALLWKLIAHLAGQMTPEERALGRQWLAEGGAWDVLQTHAWLSLAQVDDLELTRAEQVVWALSDEQAAPLLYARLLNTYVRYRGASPSEAISAAIEAAAAADADATLVLLGAGHLLDDADLVEPVSEVLEALLNAAPFCDDVRLDTLRGLISI